MLPAAHRTASRRGGPRNQPGYDREVTTRHTRFTIRRATSDDIESIAALHLAGSWFAYRGIVPDAFLDSQRRGLGRLLLDHAVRRLAIPETRYAMTLGGSTQGQDESLF